MFHILFIYTQVIWLGNNVFDNNMKFLQPITTYDRKYRLKQYTDQIVDIRVP